MATYFGSGDSSSGGIPREVLLPSKLLDSKVMSSTSLATNCFVGQQFSNKLQAYLIGYVNSIYSDYAVPS